MDLRLALILLPLLMAPAFADMTPATADAQKQPRTLGQKAVLHIYYYAPKTLEITYVDSYLFKDEDACKNAIGAALQIAMPYAGDGDLVQCGQGPVHGGVVAAHDLGAQGEARGLRHPGDGGCRRARRRFYSCGACGKGMAAHRHPDHTPPF